MSTVDAASIPFRMRHDLEVTEIMSGTLRLWTIKDPVALRYFQLRAEEYAVLTLLDGDRSAAEISKSFSREFPGQRLNEKQLKMFLTQLAAQGLLVNSLPSQGDALFERGQATARTRRLGRWTNPFALRILAFDPRGMIDRLYPWTRWLFSARVQGLLAAAVLLTTVFMLANWRTLEARLPAANTFLSGANLVWLVCAYALAKTVHELGHALTCRHFQCECHEMGVMLLVFAPCLFCDVSDGWVLKERWKRLAISAAGIIVEVYIAAACLWIWLASEPGILNSLALNLVFVCTVSTLAFNANPLLRFDGYYMLADWLGIPNLRQNAQRIVADTFSRLVLGVRSVSQRMLFPRLRWGLTFYWVAALIYRILVVWALVWGLDYMLNPWGLRPLAVALGGWLAFSMIWPPVRGVVRFTKASSSAGHMNPIRSAAGVVILGGLLGTVLFMPWQQRLRVPFVIEPANANYLHASIDGRLVKSLPVGSEVARDQPLVWLEDDALNRQMLKLEGEQQQVQTHLDGLLTRQVRDSEAAAEIPATRERLVDIERRIETLGRQVSRLTVTSPAEGHVLPARPRIDRRQNGELPVWSGSAMAQHNRGCLIERETLLCVIGDPRKLEAHLLVNQSDINMIRTGQIVDLFVVEDDCEVTGRVSAIAPANVDRVPVELLDDRWIPVRKTESGQIEPLETLYRVTVTFTERPRHASINSVGIARVRLPSMSIWDRTYRYLSQSFQFGR